MAGLIGMNDLASEYAFERMMSRRQYGADASLRLRDSPDREGDAVLSRNCAGFFGYSDGIPASTEMSASDVAPSDH